MRLLVTGVNGFVGRHLVNAWREHMPAVEIWGLDRGRHSADLPIPFFHVDLRDGEAVRDGCRKIAPDWVIHLAAQSFVPRAFANPQETWEINLWGTFRLLEAL